MMRIRWVLGVLLIGGCGNDARTTGATSGAQPASAAPLVAASTGAVASSVASASSSPTNDCERHGLTLGGSGSHQDPCKYSGEVLSARFTGRMAIAADQSEGAEIAFTNPWPESVARLSVALFYYDREGKQLEVTIHDKTKKAIVLTDVQVDIPGKTTQNLVLGPDPANVPLGADTVEVRVLAFALGFSGEFSSVEPLNEDRARRGGPSSGTGVSECDAYIALATKCAVKSDSGSKQRLASVGNWRHRSSPDAKKCTADIARLDKSCR